VAQKLEMNKRARLSYVFSYDKDCGQLMAERLQVFSSLVSFNDCRLPGRGQPVILRNVEDTVSSVWYSVAEL
jgi:hypothetical protein